MMPGFSANSVFFVLFLPPVGMYVCMGAFQKFFFFFCGFPIIIFLSPILLVGKFFTLSFHFSSLPF